MILFYLLFFIFTSGHSSADENVIVKTPLGNVLGYLDISFNNRSFLAFEGIPYAKAPIGDKRFKEPEPIDPWDGIWNATVGTTCAQISQSVVVGVEDCLHVNVYVPREVPNPEEKLEVVVHIHGGGFTVGSGTMYSKPTYVMDKEIIFVTFNYRLGIFGFLSTEDEVVPGNNGLKDQVLALRWVQENIASFGGNPDSVTLNGMSAGSASAHLHYFSDLSKGLFHRGFVQSGIALNPWVIVEGALEKAKKLAAALDCRSDTTQNLVDCLRTKSLEDILPTIDIFSGYKFLPLDPFGPVVDKASSNPFLKEHPYLLLATGQIQDLPLIISNTDHEGTLIVSRCQEDDFVVFNKQWDELAPIIFDFNYTLPEEFWANASETIRHFYFGDLEISFDRAYMMILPVTHRYFLYDTETVMRIQSNVSNSPVYYLEFAYPGNSDPPHYVIHGAEIKYMYGGASLTEDELKMKDLLWDMVVNYAKTGTPTFGSAEWEPTKPEEHVYLYVSGTESEDMYLWTRKQFTNNEFWKGLNFSENENLFNV